MNSSHGTRLRGCAAQRSRHPPITWTRLCDLTLGIIRLSPNFHLLWCGGKEVVWVTHKVGCGVLIMLTFHWTSTVTMCSTPQSSQQNIFKCVQQFIFSSITRQTKFPLKKRENIQIHKRKKILYIWAINYNYCDAGCLKKPRMAIKGCDMIEMIQISTLTHNMIQVHINYKTFWKEACYIFMSNPKSFGVHSWLVGSRQRMEHSE